MSKELATIEQQHTPLMPVMQIEQAKQRYQAMVELTKNVLREGHDFGTVPGIDKKFLHKAGAEKITTFFGLRAEFELVKCTEDWTGKDYDGEPFFYYWFRCSLWRGDQKMGEADGSCNSREPKYRWRKQDRLCPVCEGEFIIKGRQEYGGGWLCFKKRGGCGAKFNDGDHTIEGQKVGRVLNEDICGQTNTLLKMAQKRALVAATLITANASEFFTQDIEDYAEEYIEGEYTVAQPEPKKKPAKQSREPSRDNLTAAYSATYHAALERKMIIESLDMQHATDTEIAAATAILRGYLNSKRPLDPDTVIAKLRTGAEWQKTETGWQQQPADEQEPPQSKAVQRAAALLEAAVGVGDKSPEMRRHDLISLIFGKESLKDHTAAEINTFLAWAEKEPGSWEINPFVTEEARQILAMAANHANAPKENNDND